jgi:hypothetical protein
MISMKEASGEKASKATVDGLEAVPGQGLPQQVMVEPGAAIGDHAAIIKPEAPDADVEHGVEAIAANQEAPIPEHEAALLA